MASELNMYQAQVSEYQFEIERLARELSEAKKKYLGQKRKEATLRERERALQTGVSCGAGVGCQPMRRAAADAPRLVAQLASGWPAPRQSASQARLLREALTTHRLHVLQAMTYNPQATARTAGGGFSFTQSMDKPLA